jgi:hypothetical protein
VSANELIRLRVGRAALLAQGPIYEIIQRTKRKAQVVQATSTLGLADAMLVMGRVMT